MGGESIVCHVSGKTYAILPVETLGGSTTAVVANDCVFVRDQGDAKKNREIAARALDHHARSGIFR